MPQAVFVYFLRFAMAWLNYHFVDLSAAEKVARRQTLDKYALYAQLSALVPVAAVLLYRLAKWAVASKGSRNGNYAVVPSSPVQKVRRHSSLGTCASRSRRARWWLGEDVVAFGTVLGQRDRTCFFLYFQTLPSRGCIPYTACIADQNAIKIFAY